MLNETKKGLFDLLTGSNIFGTAIKGQVYFEEANEDSKYPLAIINDVAPDIKVDSATVMPIEIFQIRILDYTSSSKSVGELTERLWNVLDNAEQTLIISGYHILSILDVPPRGYTYKTDLIWNSITGYKIQLQK